MNQPNLSDDARRLLTSAISRLDDYYDFVTQLYGIVAFGLALGAVSTENPKLYAFISMVFIVLTFAMGVRRYRRLFKLLQNIEHPTVRLSSSLPNVLVPLLGMIFLACVAFGLLDKHGLVP